MEKNDSRVDCLKYKRLQIDQIFCASHYSQHSHVASRPRFTHSQLESSLADKFVRNMKDKMLNVARTGHATTRYQHRMNRLISLSALCKPDSDSFALFGLALNP